MRHPTLDQDELWRLLNALVDDRLDDAGRARLRKRLHEDLEARAVYCEFLAFHAQLRTQYVELLANLDFVPVPTTEPMPCNFLSGAVALPRLSVLAATLLIGVLMYGTFGFIVWQMSRYQAAQRHDETDGIAELKKTADDRPIARLISGTNCQWNESTRRLQDGDRLNSGMLRLVRGFANIEFGMGARVMIEGPCNLELRTASKGFLRSGKLAAHVPRRAVGFEVETPDARVVDLGTDFRLEAGHTATRLSVTAGKVDLYPKVGMAKRQGETTLAVCRVAAGEAVTISRGLDGGHQVQETHFDAAWLSTVASKLSRSPLPTTCVAYQIANGSAGNRRDFYGGVGLDFEVRVPIRIFSLGVFDHLGDGIDPATSPTVQLWSRDMMGTPDDASDDVGRTIITSLKFSARDDGELKLGHRFKSLPKPIDLPIGTYSIVAYGLSDANPFVAFDNSKSNLDFSTDPGWIGINNTQDGNRFGWSSTTNRAGEKAGEIGGIFSRGSSESSYGDTTLSQTFSLHDAIFASGSFRVSDIETMDGQFFVGHYSSSPAFGAREFIGMEFLEGGLGGIRVRARMNLREGIPSVGATSSWIDLNARENYHFEYIYDPTYEANGSHNGPEGMVTLRVRSEGFLIDQTVAAVLEGSHRDSHAVFDAFGMGIATYAVLSDDATKTVQAFIDNVHYSGLQEKSLLKSTVNASEQLVPQGRIETWHGSIIPTGSRLEECEPGAFPRAVSGGKIGYAAGSFEYCPQGRAEGEKK